MAKSTVLETAVSESFGPSSRHKNTEKIWVPPSAIVTGTVTGTWALEVASNVQTLATDDVGGAGEILIIPYTGEFSDAMVEGNQDATDRGVKILGLELIYAVAASALAAMDLDIFHLTPAADGAVTAAETTTTLTFDTDGDTGVEIDDHRAYALVAEIDRTFVDSGNIPQGLFTISDGTASDVNIAGALWHIERVVE